MAIQAVRQWRKIPPLSNSIFANSPSIAVKSSKRGRAIGRDKSRETLKLRRKIQKYCELTQPSSGRSGPVLARAACKYLPWAAKNELFFEFSGAAFPSRYLSFSLPLDFNLVLPLNLGLLPLSISQLLLCSFVFVLSFLIYGLCLIKYKFKRRKKIMQTKSWNKNHCLKNWYGEITKKCTNYRLSGQTGV